METAGNPAKRESYRDFLFVDGKLYYGWVLVFLGFLLMSFAYVSFLSVTSVFVIPVTTALGVDRGAFVLYQTILCGSSLIFMPIFGKRMAQGNIKLIMAISAILSGVAYVGFSQATALWHIYCWAALLGLGFANVTVLPISILINNWFGGKIRGTAMGIAFIGSGVGGIALIPVLNWVITSYGWRSGYLTLTGFFLLVLLPSILLLVVKTPEEKGMSRLAQAEGETSIAEANGMTVKEALKTPMLWLAFLSCLFFVIASSGILFNSAPFFIECGFTKAEAALFAAFNVGMLAVGKPLTGWFCDRFGTKLGSILSCFIFAGAMFFLFILPTNPWLFIPFCIVFYGIGCGGVTVCPPLLVNSLFGEKDYASIVAVLNIGTNLGGALGGMTAAWIYDFTGSYTTFWLMVACGMVMAGIFRIIAFQLRKKYSY